MVAYRYDSEHIAPANAAPRCQHIRLNGRRCGAPARRRYCRFHEHVALSRHPDFKVRFIEDATTLQFALMEVMRLLDSRAPDYRACGLKLYALQIACSNMKALRAEQVEVEQREVEPGQAQAQRAQAALAARMAPKVRNLRMTRAWRPCCCASCAILRPRTIRDLQMLENLGHPRRKLLPNSHPGAVVRTVRPGTIMRRASRNHPRLRPVE